MAPENAEGNAHHVRDHTADREVPTARIEGLGRPRAGNAQHDRGQRDRCETANGESALCTLVLVARGIQRLAGEIGKYESDANDDQRRGGDDERDRQIRSLEPVRD